MPLSAHTYADRGESHRLHHLLADPKGIVDAFELLAEQVRRYSSEGYTEHVEEVIVQKKTVSRVTVVGLQAGGGDVTYGEHVLHD